MKLVTLFRLFWNFKRLLLLINFCGIAKLSKVIRDAFNNNKSTLCMYSIGVREILFWDIVYFECSMDLLILILQALVNWIVFLCNNCITAFVLACTLFIPYCVFLFKTIWSYLLKIRKIATVTDFHLKLVSLWSKTDLELKFNFRRKILSWYVFKLHSC